MVNLLNLPSKFIGLRLQELEQQAYNERMLAAACAGDLVAVEESLRKKGDCNSQQTPGIQTPRGVT